ncbi:MAG: hypothetical protein IKS07_01495 [Lachnospiraceae bacterium]|nr:hypothetical protein [Lachnospiraceae bacterium]
MSKHHVKRVQIHLMSALLPAAAFYLMRSRLGEAGLGYFAISYLGYLFMLLLFDGGVADETARMLRSRINRGHRTNVRIVWTAVLGMQIFSGILAGVLLGAGGYFLSVKSLHIPHAAWVWAFWAPALFLRMVNSVYASYAKGRFSDTQVSISLLCRAVFFPVLSFFFFSQMENYGRKVSALLLDEDFSAMYGCIGICIGAAAAEALVFFYLLVVRILGIRFEASPSESGRVRRDRSGAICLSVWGGRGLQMLSAVLLLGYAFGLFFLCGKTENLSLAPLSGEFFTLSLLPFLLVTVSGGAMTLPFAARCNASFAKEAMRNARVSFQAGFHLSVLLGTFGFSSVFALSRIWLIWLGKGGEGPDSGVLMALGFAVLFTVVDLFFYRLLIMRDLKLFVCGANLLAAVVGIFVFRALLPGKGAHTGAAVSMAVVAGMLCLLYGLLAAWKLNMNYDPVSSILVPLGCGVLLGLVEMFLSRAIAPHLGYGFTMVLCTLIFGVLYTISLLLLRNFNEWEIRHYPGGRLLEGLGQLLRVL